MLNRITFALIGGLSVIGYTALQLQTAAWSQSEAMSEAGSEATSEATSEASSQASAESMLVFGRTGYEVYQPWPRRYMQPLGPSGWPWQTMPYQRPWPPAYMQPIAQNGGPLWSAQDSGWVYWDGSRPTAGYAGYPVPNLAPLPAPFPAPVPLAPPAAPKSHYGFARVIPRGDVLQVPLPSGFKEYSWAGIRPHKHETMKRVILKHKRIYK
jgi:hypothetical protein